MFATMAALLSVGCGASPVGEGSPAGAGTPHTAPLDGTWTGDQINFELANGQVSAWFVQDVECSAVNENVNAPEKCTEVVKSLPDDPAAVEGGTFVVDLGDLAIAGTFDAAGHVSGSWTFRPEDCCTSSGTWEAWHHTWADTKGDPNATDGTDPSVVPGGDVAGSSDGTDPQNGSDTTDATDDAGTVQPPPRPGQEYGVPADASPDQLEAISRVNWYRKNVDAPLMDMHSAVNAACVAHAEYWAAHKQEYQSGMIPGGAHFESAEFSDGFTGKSFGDRMKAAGYGGSPGYEVIAFVGSPSGAVDGWVATVYHRIPILSPDAVDGGYGGAPGIDVMDFGRKGWPKPDTFILYPWPGQTGVPRKWSGNESPQPPPPANGYPSGPVVTVIVPGGSPLEITSHELLAPGNKSVPHVWHPKGSNGFMSSTWALYSNDPLAAQTTYTVVLAGTYQSSPWKREWSFTTGK